MIGFSSKDGKTFLAPKDGGIPEDKSDWMHLAKPTTNYNALNNKWNTCEIIVMGGEYTIHKLNGEIVNMAFNLTPESGIIGFQSETAEIYYRNIRIKEFETAVPIELFLD
ncbi:family 16 glycoside hydrolase [Formosa sp. L2A11]|uniref:family 16 glycoside hydrolase n=1 Tax=Formosa sp. L2A11 TaxID=2686363 RepID=UPI00131C9CA9|nr:family 16 glycoside hydrolase [Formosa sp. L2A11]